MVEDTITYKRPKTKDPFEPHSFFRKIIRFWNKSPASRQAQQHDYSSNVQLLSEKFFTEPHNKLMIGKAFVWFSRKPVLCPRITYLNIVGTDQHFSLFNFDCRRSFSAILRKGKRVNFHSGDQVCVYQVEEGKGAEKCLTTKGNRWVQFWAAVENDVCVDVEPNDASKQHNSIAVAQVSHSKSACLTQMPLQNLSFRSSFRYMKRQHVVDFSVNIKDMRRTLFDISHF